MQEFRVFCLNAVGMVAQERRSWRSSARPGDDMGGARKRSKVHRFVVDCCRQQSEN